MKAYRLQRATGVAGLEMIDVDVPPPQGHDVVVRMRAVALNYRDLLPTRTTAASGTIMPCSDGAGEVVAVGSDVTRLRIGDRVATSFFPHWTDGPATPANTDTAMGGPEFGALAEFITLPEHALFNIPDTMEFHEAATLPCAGVTAWNALFTTGGLPAGDTVLLLGTGGVSIWTLQLAKAAGLRTIITSSSDSKLAAARRLGADETINYRAVQDWPARVRELTGGEGVDLVLETIGRETISQSLASARHGGQIAIIGGTTGWNLAFNGSVLINRALRVTGLLVGSGEMAEQLVQYVDRHGIHPVIDRRFAFADARAAYEYLANAQHLGKIVVDV